VSSEIVEAPGLEAPVRLRAFSWLAAHRDRFLANDTVSTSRELFSRKAFAELALLVGLASRVRERVPDHVYATLVGCLTSVAVRPSFRELAARDRSALLLYASTCAALRLVGRDDPELRWSIEQLVGGRYATAVERVPFRYLDLLHALETARIPHNLPSIEAVLPFTILVADPNVVEIRDADAYAVTHTLFYASDFGAREVPWPAGYDAGRAIDLVNALLVLYRLRGNADLVAELICSLACLNVHGTPELARAWNFLAEAQLPDGRVPGPGNVVPAEFMQEDVASRNWLTSYHTTIVTALAGLLSKHSTTVSAVYGSPSLVEDQLHTTLRRGVDWVARKAPRWTADAAVPALAAAGVAIRHIGGSPTLNRELRRFVALVDTEGGPDWSELGGEVVLSFALVLRERSITCLSLQRFLAELAAALAKEPAALKAAPAAARSLRELELLSDPVASLVSRAEPLPAALRDGENRPLELAAAVVCFAGLRGGMSVRETSEWLASGEVLALALADACREYRLGEAAALLRALLVLGWADHRIVTDAVDMLVRQQTLSGAFGYTASDCDHARATDQRHWTQSLLVALSDLARLRT
jgi:hypothetical protein